MRNGALIVLAVGAALGSSALVNVATAGAATDAVVSVDAANECTDPPQPVSCTKSKDYTLEGWRRTGYVEFRCPPGRLLANTSYQGPFNPPGYNLSDNRIWTIIGMAVTDDAGRNIGVKANDLSNTTLD